MLKTSKTSIVPTTKYIVHCDMCCCCNKEYSIQRNQIYNIHCHQCFHFRDAFYEGCNRYYHSYEVEDEDEKKPETDLSWLGLDG